MHRDEAGQRGDGGAKRKRGRHAKASKTTGVGEESRRAMTQRGIGWGGRVVVSSFFS